MKNSVFILLTFLLFCVACNPPEKPNIILVITDDQGYGDLACHGNPWLKTPNIDQLYNEGVRLTDFHVSPTCSPTRGALLTGRYTDRVGSWHTISSREMVFEEEVMLQEVLKENGYSTALFGKWHLGDNHPFRPQDRGFDETFMHLAGGVGQAPDYWLNNYYNDTYFRNGKPEKAKGYCTDVWFDNAMEYIGRKADEKQPFFCYLSTNAPHGPYYVEDKYKQMYEGVDGVVNPAFYGMISNIDDNMGKLMKFLDQKKIADNTLLIFMTDNGAGNGSGFKLNWKTKQVKAGYNANMRGSKASMYEGGHRVPFIVRWPAKGVQGGRDVEELTAHIDFFPTLVNALSLKGAEQLDFDGTNILDLLTGKEQQLPERVIVTDNQRVLYPEKWKMSSTMKGKWRLINGTELYHVKEDPSQQNDVSDRHPELVKELRTAYEKWWEDIEPDMKRLQHITLCDDTEETTLLSAMDIMKDSTQTKTIWKQEHVRDQIEKYKGTGWYIVKAPKKGKYSFTLMRYPPEAQLALGAVAPAVPRTIGTNIVPYKEAKALAITTATLQIDNQEERIEKVDINQLGHTFEVELKEGKHQLRTHFIVDDGSRYPAMYVKVERSK